jgi:hypothetical protein
MEQEDTNNLRYIVVPSEFLSYVNYSYVEQTCPESLRYSIDKKFFLLKYLGDQPDFCYNITEDLIGLEEYTHKEILEILSKNNNQLIK